MKVNSPSKRGFTHNWDHLSCFHWNGKSLENIDCHIESLNLGGETDTDLDLFLENDPVYDDQEFSPPEYHRIHISWLANVPRACNKWIFMLGLSDISVKRSDPWNPAGPPSTLLAFYTFFSEHARVVLFKAFINCRESVNRKVSCSWG